MANIVYRSATIPGPNAEEGVTYPVAKGTPLLNTEIDGNFRGINDELATKAPTESPALTGTPTAPTADADTNTTQIATTAFVNAERSNTATLTNKSIALGSNTVTGTIAEFNTALTDADFATLSGTETLSNKTLTSPTVSGLYLSDSSITFEGSAVDNFETIITVTNPTADRTITIPNATGTVALTNNKLSAFAATTSAELAGVISDETGTGVLVFGTSPVLTTPTINTSATVPLIYGATTASGSLTLSSTSDAQKGDVVLGGSGDTVKLNTTTAGFVKTNSSGVLSIDTTSYYYDGGPDVKVDDGGTGISTAPSNGQLLIGNGTGYTLSTLTQGTGITVTNAAGSITVAHTDTSTQSSVNNSGNTFIQDITLDTFGHITAITSATATQSNDFGTFAINGTDSGYTWGTANANTNQVADTTGDTLTLVKGGGINLYTNTVAGTDAIKIEHADTSSQASVDNSGNTFIQDITLDEYGHITAITSATAAESDTLQSVTDRGKTTTNDVTITNATSSTTSATGALKVTGGVGIGENLNVGGNAVITGNLTVNGTTTTVNSTTVTIDDKNIELGSVATPTNTTADGGGITLKGTTDKTFNWVDATAAWTSSENLELAAGKTLRVKGSTSGTASITAPAAAGTPTLTLPTSTGTFALTSDIGNGAFTVTAGAGLTGGGQLGTANQSSNTSITVSHADTSTQASVNNSGNTFIQDITLDTYGHITAITSATATQSNDFGAVTVTDTDSGYTWAETGSAAADATGDTLTVVSGGAINVDVDAASDAIRISHVDTSSVGNLSSDNSGNTFIQDISFTFDTYGHVTAATVATGTATQSNDFGTFAIDGTDSGYTWGTANANTNQVADTTGDTLTLVKGGGINLYTNTVAGTDAIKIEHADTSSVANLSSDNSGNTFIQDISFTFDTYGHVTAATVATGTATQSNDFGTVTVTDTDSGYTWAETGSAAAETTGDTLTVVSGGGINVDVATASDAIRISHADTSSQASVDNSGVTFIQDITLDTYGHITAIGSGSVPKATSSALGLVELGSDTVQTVAANAVTTAASRTYAVQLNAADQMVVNVPWVDTNTLPNNGTLTMGVSGSGLSGSQTFTADQASNATFTVTSNATSANTASTIVFRDASGNFTAGVINATDFNSTSDARLKENVTGISGLDMIRDLNPIQFNWKESGKKSYGLIAQEIENILPELVNVREDGMKGVSYIPIIAMLVDAVKKLEARVNELER